MGLAGEGEHLKENTFCWFFVYRNKIFNPLFTILIDMLYSDTYSSDDFAAIEDPDGEWLKIALEHHLFFLFLS